MSDSNLYQLLDCGDKQKLEKFGKYIVLRPCPQALWKKRQPDLWQKIDLEFIRTSNEKGVWKKHNPKVPDTWSVISKGNLKWQISPNQFGNVGIFTEHWLYSFKLPEFFDSGKRVLNLFSYTGSNCLDLVKAGYKVTVVDSSKNAMTTYAENLNQNKLSREGQRLILEDALKFVAREIRREKSYDAIMIDAPSFGRGTKGEVFNIEDNLLILLKYARDLMHSDTKLVFTLHSPRFTIGILQNLFVDIFDNTKIEIKELLNPCLSGVTLPSGFLVMVG